MTPGSLSPHKEPTFGGSSLHQSVDVPTPYADQPLERIHDTYHRCAFGPAWPPGSSWREQETRKRADTCPKFVVEFLFCARLDPPPRLLQGLAFKPLQCFHQ